MVKFLTLLAFCCFQLAYPQQPLYKQAEIPIEKRIKDLLKRMTVEEKILQLNQYKLGANTNINNIGAASNEIPAGIGSLIYFGGDPEFRNQIQKKAVEESRLGIPILFGYDIIHGCRTLYPIPLAQACSWNLDLVKTNSSMSAKETVLSGVDWVFSPMIDVSRDPRWGRVAEGYGEDPYVNAVFGVATIQGYQGTSLSDPYSVAACLKHYVGYGMSEGGRDYRYSNISKQSLWETYLPSFEAGINAGAATVMSSFNDISGIPATSNYYTLTEILKKRWKHDGFVVSDWNAIEQLINQGVAQDKKEAGMKAFLAGVEMDMIDNIYLEHFKELLAEKKISIQSIDEAVTRILRVKFRLGLFENPYTTIIEKEKRYLQPESIKNAAKLAEESIVLLKNENNILPISPLLKKIALVGPMAKDKQNLMGSWSGYAKSADVETIFSGMEKEFSNKAQLNYAKGCDFDGDDESGFEEAIKVANQSDIIVVCLGERRVWSGENASRSTLSLPIIQEKLVEELKKTGKPIVLILSNGRPIELERLEKFSDAILEIWQPGVAGGTPVAGIVSGRINPSAKLAITFPLVTGQIPTYYNMRPSAREAKLGAYQDKPTEPLYWFGHGLSYTTYKYSEATLSSPRIKPSEKLTVQVKVTNTGDVSGKESVLWYISDPVSSISRPLKELKFFEKKEIPAGNEVVYTFEIDPNRDLAYYDEEGHKILEPGIFYVHVDDQKIKFELLK
ncbi:glycoside hydrolase family 3 N-terminal domain-containing protein [Flavobacterium psychrotrophum]|uniref:glycoside hydrolase family 3 N-terminal domain-containing protein n=1 Tax=Flavobacterium psychrotrophum TaxID=2294119 RepID=UPI0019699DA9|nr:glycoside hydrolase family 3 N-terminal domain-containing protein [Flavobacterium psychrotrophum]